MTIARKRVSGGAIRRLLILVAVCAVMLSVAVASRTFLSWYAPGESASTIQVDRSDSSATVVADGGHEKPISKADVVGIPARKSAAYSPFAVTDDERDAEIATVEETEPAIDLAERQESAEGFFDRSIVPSDDTPSVPSSPSDRQFLTRDAGTAAWNSSGTDGQEPFVAGEREDPSAGSTISGRVVTGSGDPVLDHPVAVLGRTDGQAAGRAVSTDQSGRFVIGGLESGDYLLRAGDSAFYAGRTVPARAGTSGLELVIALRDFVKIEGVVTDDFGTPIAAAAVIPPLVEERALTNERGEFALDVSAIEQGGLLVRYAAEGFLDETRFFPAGQWESGDTLDASVRLRRGLFAVQGSVYDEYGYPVDNALVQITSLGMGSHQSTQVDPEGRFALESVLAADDYVLRISSTARYRPFVIENLAVDGGLGDLDVTLAHAPLGTLSGTLVATSGSPLSRLSLLASASGGKGGRSAAVVSDDEGRFVLEDFATGEIRLRSRTRPDFEIEGVHIRPGEQQTLTFVVDIGEQGLEGLVTDAAGLPVAGARLTMKSVRHDGTIRTTTTRETRSGADGAFHFPGLGRGRRSLTVVADSLGVQRMTVDPAAGNGPIVVALSR